MDMALRVLAVAFGAALVVVALASAIKTVVLPRATVSIVTRGVFLTVQHVFRVLARPSLPLAKRDRRLAWYSPLGLVGILVTWLTLTLAGFTLIFWGVENLSMREAFVESGSALLTLGLTRPGSLPGVSLAFIEAGIGLFLLALLITYLPSIYAAFSPTRARRDRARDPRGLAAMGPDADLAVLGAAAHGAPERRVGGVGAVVRRRRGDAYVAAGRGLLPIAAARPPLGHRGGRGARRRGARGLDGRHRARRAGRVLPPRRIPLLRRIADYYNFAHNPDPKPDDPISITRSEWDDAVTYLEEAGVPLKADREQAWRDFAGWRVNYDAVCSRSRTSRARLRAPWSSDRSGARPCGRGSSAAP